MERLVERLAAPDERLLVLRFAPERPDVERLDDEPRAVDRLVDRPPEAVVFLAVLFARPLAPLAVLLALVALRFAVLFARVVALLAFLRAPVADRLAAPLARLVVLLALFDSASARVAAAFATALTALPADLAARLAAGAAAFGPDAADLTAVRADRTASLPLFAAALRWRVAAAFFADAWRWAFV